MTKYLFVLVCLSFIPPSFAVNLDGTFPANKVGEASAPKRFPGADPLKNKNLKPALPPAKFDNKTYNSVRLDGDLQLHPSCELEAERLKVSPKELKSKMDAHMRRMMDRMLSCIHNYPEMKGYVEEAIAQTRRQSFKCEAPFGAKGMYNRPKGENYWAYNAGGEIVVSSSMLDALVGPASSNEKHSDKAMASIFHELLHSTHANNRHDHNDVELKGAKIENLKANCEDNVSMDRVNIIESLCIGAHLSASKEDAAQIMADRMDMCGTDKGCRETFTAKGNNFDEEWPWLRIPNRDISNAAATKLCQRIKDDGRCLHMRKTQGKTITDSNAKIKDARKELEIRLNKILPRNESELSEELIALYPEVDKRYQALKGTSCFKAAFKTFPEAPGKFYSKHTKLKGITWKDWAKIKTNLRKHVRNIEEEAYEKMRDATSCKDENKEIDGFLSALNEKIYNTDSLQQLNVVAHSLLTGAYPTDPVLRNEKSEISRFLGPALNNYIKTLDKLHYQSPSFDCVAAGLAPFRAVEDANREPACEE